MLAAVSRRARLPCRPAVSRIQYLCTGNQDAKDSTKPKGGVIRFPRVLKVAAVATHPKVPVNQQLYIWGTAEDGKLGLGVDDHNVITPVLASAVDDRSKETFCCLQDRESPCLVETLQDLKFQNVACGKQHSAAVTGDMRIHGPMSLPSHTDP